LRRLDTREAGTRSTLLASLLVFAIALARAALFLSEPFSLLASRFVVGFASACAATTCVWGIASEYEGTMRARALGISAAVANFAALGSTLLGGLLAERGGWQLAFAQFPVFGLIGLALAYASIRQARPARERSSQGVVVAALCYGRSMGSSSSCSRSCSWRPRSTRSRWTKQASTTPRAARSSWVLSRWLRPS
jgi:MFS family permease